MPSSEPFTPIVIGIADVVNRSLSVQDATEPLELMLQAIHQAIADTGLSAGPATDLLQASIDSVDVVRTWTWPYPDLPSLLSTKLGIAPSHRHCSPHGGHQPAKLLDGIARRIARGESSVAVLVGGEALASLSACATAGKLPPPGWTPTSQAVDAVFSPTTMELPPGLGALHSIGHPIQIYPLYENALRARRRLSIPENHRESAQLYADFARVAARHPYAWGYGNGKAAETAETIGTVTRRNRMICFPYPLLMNAFNAVNLAAACLLTSTARARELGIPESRWIYPLAGAGAQDSSDFLQRANFHSSPALSRSIDTCLSSAGLSKDDIDLYDFYSCFPVVPKLACLHLGISIEKPARPITLLGGLTSFGGAGNNYSMHALTELVRQLRQGNGVNGLVLANGGAVTDQHAVILSSKLRANSTSYPQILQSPEFVEDVPIPLVDSQATGDSVVETYTVDYERDGTPLRGHVVGRLLASGHRFLANHGDGETLEQLCSGAKEPIGKVGWVHTDAMSGRNLFCFRERQKL